MIKQLFHRAVMVWGIAFLSFLTVMALTASAAETPPLERILSHTWGDSLSYYALYPEHMVLLSDRLERLKADENTSAEAAKLEALIAVMPLIGVDYYHASVLYIAGIADLQGFKAFVEEIGDPVACEIEEWEGAPALYWRSELAGSEKYTNSRRRILNPEPNIFVMISIRYEHNYRGSKEVSVNATERLKSLINDGVYKASVSPTEELRREIADDGTVHEYVRETFKPDANIEQEMEKLHTAYSNWAVHQEKVRNGGEWTLTHDGNTAVAELRYSREGSERELFHLLYSKLLNNFENIRRTQKETRSQFVASPGFRASSDAQLQLVEAASAFNRANLSSYALSTLARGAAAVLILGAFVLIMRWRGRVFVFNRWVYLVCMLLVLPPAIVPFKLGVSRPALYEQAVDSVRISERWLNPAMLVASIGRGDDATNAEVKRPKRESLSYNQKAALILSLKVDWLLAFYLGVMGLFLLRQLRRYCRWGFAVRRLLRLDDERAVAIFREACGVCALKPERVKLLAGAGRMEGPASYNFFGGGVIIGTDAARALSDDELRMVFLHELTHIRNRDQYMVGLASLINIAQWYNPFVYMLRRRFCVALEFECDARVMRLVTADKEAKGRYARMLLSFYRGGGANCVVGLSTNARELERRIKGIFSAGNRRRYRAWFSVVVLTMVVAAVVVVAGMEKRKADVWFGKYALDGAALVYARITPESFALSRSGDMNEDFARISDAIGRVMPISLILSGRSEVFYIPALEGLDDFKEFYEGIQIRPLIDCHKNTVLGHQILSVYKDDRYRDVEVNLSIVNPEPHVFVVIEESAVATYLRGEYTALSQQMLEALSSISADEDIIFLTPYATFAMKLLSADECRMRSLRKADWYDEAVKSISDGSLYYGSPSGYVLGKDVVEGVTVDKNVAANILSRIVRLMNGWSFSD